MKKQITSMFTIAILLILTIPVFQAEAILKNDNIRTNDFNIKNYTDLTKFLHPDHFKPEYQPENNNQVDIASSIQQLKPIWVRYYQDKTGSYDFLYPKNLILVNKNLYFIVEAGRSENNIITSADALLLKYNTDGFLLKEEITKASTPSVIIRTVYLFSHNNKLFAAADVISKGISKPCLLIYDYKCNLLDYSTPEVENLYHAHSADASQNYIYVTGAAYIGANYYPFILQYDNEGKLVRYKIFQDYYNGEQGISYSICYHDKHLYITGPVVEECVINKIFLMKINENLEIVYKKFYTKGNTGNHRILIHNHNIYISCTKMTSLLPLKSKHLLIKLNLNGEILWEKENGIINRNLMIPEETIVYNNYLYICGAALDVNLPQSKSESDAFIARYKIENGELDWIKTWDKYKYEYASGLAVDNKGFLYMEGDLYTDDKSIPSLFLLKCDKDGGDKIKNADLNKNLFFKVKQLKIFSNGFLSKILAKTW